jgi:exonuclease VII large subunit
MPANPTDEYRKKNQELARQNTKHSLRIRKLEHEVIQLKQQIMEQVSQSFPMNKVRDVIRATLNEYDSLQLAIKENSKRFDDHARRGLLAILCYNSGSSSQSRIPERKSSRNSPPTQQQRFKKKIDFHPTSLTPIEELASRIPKSSPKKVE